MKKGRLNEEAVDLVVIVLVSVNFIVIFIANTNRPIIYYDSLLVQYLVTNVIIPIFLILISCYRLMFSKSYCRNILMIILPFFCILYMCGLCSTLSQNIFIS